MLNNFIYIICLVLLLGGCAPKPVLIEWGDCLPYPYTPKYIGQVAIPFCYIINTDSINLVTTNLDSLLNRVVYPSETERSGRQGGITITFKLDSTRVAKDIKFLNRLGYNSDFEKSILNALRSFEFKFENDIDKKDLDGMLTFSFRVYDQNKRVNLIQQPQISK